MKGEWESQDVRDEVVEFVQSWHQRAGMPMGQMLSWLELSHSTYYHWQK